MLLLEILTTSPVGESLSIRKSSLTPLEGRSLFGIHSFALTHTKYIEIQLKNNFTNINFKFYLS